MTALVLESILEARIVNTRQLCTVAHRTLLERDRDKAVAEAKVSKFFCRFVNICEKVPSLEFPPRFQQFLPGARHSEGGEEEESAPIVVLCPES